MKRDRTPTFGDWPTRAGGRLDGGAHRIGAVCRLLIGGELARLGKGNCSSLITRYKKRGSSIWSSPFSYR